MFYPICKIMYFTVMYCYLIGFTVLLFYCGVLSCKVLHCNKIHSTILDLNPPEEDEEDREVGELRMMILEENMLLRGQKPLRGTQR